MASGLTEDDGGAKGSSLTLRVLVVALVLLARATFEVSSPGQQLTLNSGR